MKLTFITLLTVLIAAPALAQAPRQEPRQEPVGCDKFKWPIEKERLTLTGTDLPRIDPGQQVALPIPFGVIVALKPFADAKLPAPPERAPKSSDSFAGYFRCRRRNNRAPTKSRWRPKAGSTLSRTAIR